MAICFHALDVHVTNVMTTWMGKVVEQSTCTEVPKKRWSGDIKPQRRFLAKF